jgi:membrane protein required for colicin V production
VLKVFAPKGSALAGKLAPAIEGAVRGDSDKASDAKSGEPGYDKNQRQNLDDLVEKSR